MHEEHIDVSQVRGFALDEYLGLPLTHPEPYHSTIHRTVVEPLGLDPEKVHVPGDVLDGAPLGAGDKIAAAGPAYDAAIEAAGGIDVARAGHAVHGTTRQVLSLITNPMDVICRNIRTVREKMATRPDILGCHLEGPFLALKRKGAHDPNCLKDPVPELVDRMLDASGADLAAGKLGCIRQITISTPPTGPPNTSGAPAARWSKLLPAKSTPVPPVFETTSYA